MSKYIKCDRCGEERKIEIEENFVVGSFIQKITGCDGCMRHKGIDYCKKCEKEIFNE